MSVKPQTETTTEPETTFTLTHFLTSYKGIDIDCYKDSGSWFSRTSPFNFNTMTQPDYYSPRCSEPELAAKLSAVYIDKMRPTTK